MKLSEDKHGMMATNKKRANRHANCGIAFGDELWCARYTLEVFKPEQLTEADGFLLGFPSRFGVMAAQCKVFFDATNNLWETQALAGKPARIHGGGQELTTLLLSMLVHIGPDLGLPTNFQSRLCNEYPDKCKIVDTSYGRALELVSCGIALANPLPFPDVKPTKKLKKAYGRATDGGNRLQKA